MPYLVKKIDATLSPTLSAQVYECHVNTGKYFNTVWIALSNEIDTRIIFMAKGHDNTEPTSKLIQLLCVNIVLSFK